MLAQQVGTTCWPDLYQHVGPTFHGEFAPLERKKISEWDIIVLSEVVNKFENFTKANSLWNVHYGNSLCLLCSLWKFTMECCTNMLVQHWYNIP